MTLWYQKALNSTQQTYYEQSITVLEKEKLKAIKKILGKKDIKPWSSTNITILKEFEKVIKSANQEI